MVDIPIAISTFKTMVDIVQGMKNLNDAAKLNSAVIELQSKILSAQSDQFALIERVRDLEQQIVSAKDWEREKQRYHLQAVDSAAQAYVLKPGMENGEPPHWLCANCFNKGQKSLLSFKGQDTGPNGSRRDTSTYACDNCKMSFTVSYRRNPSTSWPPA